MPSSKDYLNYKLMRKVNIVANSTMFGMTIAHKLNKVPFLSFSFILG